VSLTSLILYILLIIAALTIVMKENIQAVIDLIDSSIKGIIFDLDGTIADTMPIHISAWKQMGLHYGADVTDDMINYYAGSPTKKVIMSLNAGYGYKMNPDEGATMKSRLFVEMLDAIAHVNPISEVMSIAKKYKGILPLGIGTGSSRINALKTIKYMGCEGFFDAVVSATDVENHKPHPESFIKAAEQMGVRPQDCIVFEDGGMGIKAALDGGMIAVEVPSFKIIYPPAS
jgi:beta-phosphoglucomutase family hydrolase